MGVLVVAEGAEQPQDLTFGEGARSAIRRPGDALDELHGVPPDAVSPCRWRDDARVREPRGEARLALSRLIARTLMRLGCSALRATSRSTASSGPDRRPPSHPGGDAEDLESRIDGGEVSPPLRARVRSRNASAWEGRGVVLGVAVVLVMGGAGALEWASPPSLGPSSLAPSCHRGSAPIPYLSSLR